VARSYLGDGVWTHTNYIGDSVIGNDVSFGAGTVTGNLRLDEKEISVTISKKWNGKTTEEKIPTGLTKLGLITGDHTRVGVNTSFMPGVKVGSNSFVGAGITVAQDVPAGSFVTGDWKLKVRPNREKITPRIVIASPRSGRSNLV
jgi:bifunctional UDP-N-acetylglucosamine pyrophosphorylase/glucosamine-1-phosphate N-acetyltransferase